MIKKLLIGFCVLFFGVSATAADVEASPPTPAIAAAAEKISVPTITRRMQYGDTIEADDIAMKEFPAVKIQGNVIRSAEEITGKTPKQAIFANQPIRKDELTGPRLIEKGAVVTMIYRTKNMEISTTGEAMQPGSDGDMIRVKNTKSGLVVAGTVTGNNVVKVAGVDN